MIFMVFKTDKNFFTKVAIRGFAPPQLLREFCLRQNRFYGLKRQLCPRPTGALEEKKKTRTEFEKREKDEKLKREDYDIESNHQTWRILR